MPFDYKWVIILCRKNNVITYYHFPFQYQFVRKSFLLTGYLGQDSSHNVNTKLYKDFLLNIVEKDSQLSDVCISTSQTL